MSVPKVKPTIFSSAKIKFFCYRIHFSAFCLACCQRVCV
jgi:hypothetical protein